VASPGRSSRRDDPRSDARLRTHYEIERELADRLRQSPPAERRALYARVYDELFARVPDHPQLQRKTSGPLSEAATMAQYRLVRRFLSPSTTFLEIGAGDCAVSVRACLECERVVAADVSEAITAGLRRPSNLELRLFDGCELPLPAGSVDVAYSNQLIEHLHADDAVLQLASILRVLRPGGVYVCVTPNRLNGPHDVSRFFDRVATGFHLREYTYGELDALMRRVGFASTRAMIGVKGRFFPVPTAALRAVEGMALLLPRPLRALLDPVLDRLLMVRLVGRKARR
jgi:SAM-dependent methyltransferase